MTVVLVCTALLTVLGAIGALTYGLKYLQTRFPKKMWWHTEHMKVVESLHLDQKNRLILVDCCQQHHLILVGPGHSLVVQNNVSVQPRGE